MISIDLYMHTSIHLIYLQNVHLAGRVSTNLRALCHRSAAFGIKSHLSCPARACACALHQTPVRTPENSRGCGVAMWEVKYVGRSYLGIYVDTITYIAHI